MEVAIVIASACSSPLLNGGLHFRSVPDTQDDVWQTAASETSNVTVGLRFVVAKDVPKKVMKVCPVLGAL
jgi:hypothetical protein